MHLQSAHQIFLDAAMNMLIRGRIWNVTASKVGELVSFMSRESIQMQIEIRGESLRMKRLG